MLPSARFEQELAAALMGTIACVAHGGRLRAPGVGREHAGSALMSCSMTELPLLCRGRRKAQRKSSTYQFGGTLRRRLRLMKRTLRLPPNGKGLWARPSMSCGAWHVRNERCPTHATIRCVHVEPAREQVRRNRRAMPRVGAGRVQHRPCCARYQRRRYITRLRSVPRGTFEDEPEPRARALRTARPAAREAR